MPDIFKAEFSQIVRARVSAAFLLSIVIFSGCSAIYKSGFVPVPVQPISSAIEISPEWVEIIPPAPLKPYGYSQYISLKFEGYKKSDFAVNENNENILELANGQNNTIEAFLFDNKGESYELKVSQTSSGPELSRKGKIKWSGEPNFSIPDYSAVHFPSDRTYIKLMIRSDMPLKCNRIEWNGRNPK